MAMAPKKSANAKKTSAKKNPKPKKVVVAVSGGFDPIHIGHVRMFENAKALGDELVVILNNDNWLKKKKGFAFMPEKERKEVIEGLRAVDRVVITKHKPNDSDMSVSHALHTVKPHIFANGGDRNEANAADPNSSLYKDLKACKELDIDMVFNVGKGGKVQSSSWLLKKHFDREAAAPVKTAQKRLKKD
jgi:D-beta-D-heptose 7-phosphate kinase/D-beta-D-heptose 1-phosphate adenosyltransferase